MDLRAEPEYADRVEYQSSEDKFTLTIRDLRQSDTAEYSFGFRGAQPDGRSTVSPGVNLTVTGHIFTSTFAISKSYNIQRAITVLFETTLLFLLHISRSPGAAEQ